MRPAALREAATTLTAAQTTFLFASDGTLITRLHAGEDRVVLAPAAQSRTSSATRSSRSRTNASTTTGRRPAGAPARRHTSNATTGEVVEGGSTITQQLVKNVYVGNEKTIGRKVSEAYLAWQLEQRLTKERILTKYLNTVYFGNGAYGIQAASETYFDMPPLELTLADAALLAGLIKAPVDYDPVTHPNRAQRRRNRVLDGCWSSG